jgi:ketosteroid isomerase-like protein
MEVLDGMWLRVDEYIDVEDGDVIVVAITFGGRARHSGLELELHPVHVFRRRDGRTVRWQIFQEREEALEAVALRE